MKVKLKDLGKISTGNTPSKKIQNFKEQRITITRMGEVYD